MSANKMKIENFSLFHVEIICVRWALQCF